MTQGSNPYRRLTAEGATHLDLLLATYDGLVQDLIRAGEAAAAGDIEARCRWSHHAVLLIGHLESWLDLLAEAPLEQSLAQFYAYVRAEILRLQQAATRSAFQDLALQVSEVRASWQSRRTPLPAAIAMQLDSAPECDRARPQWSA